MPRIGLTHERVVAQAAVLADEHGLDRLSLASVAQQFGVSLPSLYKHIRSLDSLKRDLAVRGVRELTAAMAAASVGKARRDALHALAQAYRQFAKAHPGLAAASVRAPDVDDAEYLAASDAALAVLRSVLSGYDITGSDAIDAIRMLRATMHGFVGLELAGGFGLPQSVDATYVRLVDALDSAFTTWASAPAPDRAGREQT